MRDPDVGAAVRAARDAAGLTQERAAASGVVRQAHLSRLEAGGRARTSWALVHRLITGLRLGLEHFFPPDLVLEAADRIRAARRETDP